MTGHPEAEPTLFPTAPRIIVSRCQGLESLSFALKLRDAYREVVAEGWDWRCADTMPDSAQSRLDSLADAVTLRAVSRELAYGSNGDQYLFAAVELGAGKSPELWASTRAHAAFQACPGLRP